MRVLYSLLFLLYIQCINAQTYVGLNFGYDFSNITIDDNPNAEFYSLTDKGFSVSSPTAGIIIEQSLPWNFFLGIQSQFTRKTIKAGVFVDPPLNGFRFHYIRNALILKNEVLPNFFIGTGYCMNYIGYFETGFYRPHASKMIWEGISKDFSYFDRNFENAIQMSLGYKYRFFYVEATYVHGLSFNNFISNEYINPIKTINVSLSFMYPLFKKKRVAALDCP